MKYEDIEKARVCHAELSRIFARTLSPNDAHLAPRVMRACCVASAAVDNTRLRERMQKVVEYASELFAPRATGAPVILKEQALNEKIRRVLDSFAWWVDYLEAARDARQDTKTEARRVA